MAELSEEDCLVISRTPLTIGHLRKSLQRAIETDVGDQTNSQKTQAFSDDERESDSTEADDESGPYV